MLRELIFTIGGVRIIAEIEDKKKIALFQTVVSMIRRAYTPIEEREVA